MADLDHDPTQEINQQLQQQMRLLLVAAARTAHAAVSGRTIAIQQAKHAGADRRSEVQRHYEQQYAADRYTWRDVLDRERRGEPTSETEVAHAYQATQSWPRDAEASMTRTTLDELIAERWSLSGDDHDPQREAEPESETTTEAAASTGEAILEADTADQADHDAGTIPRESSRASVEEPTTLPSTVAAYDTPDRRNATRAELTETTRDQAAVEAKMTADTANAHPPSEATRASAQQSARRPAQRPDHSRHRGPQSR